MVRNQKSVSGGKMENMWELKNTLLNNQQVREEIKREMKIQLETNKNGNKTYQN